MSLAWHLGLLGIAIVAIAAAGLRIASSLVTAVGTRVLGGIALAAGFVIAEPLLIGLTGHGADPFLLTGAAVLTWAVCRATVSVEAPAIRHQIADAWASTTAPSRAGVGAFASVVLGLTMWQLHRPRIGWDGTSYHVAQPAVWIATGHPGGLHQTVANFPTQAYPRSFETIEFWAMAISRSLIVLTPLMMAFFVLVVVAMLIGLRRVGVPSVIAALAVAAALLIPWDLQEFGEVYNDVASLAFLALAVVLAHSADDEPGAFGMAVVAAGVAIGVKTTTGPIAVIALLWVLWRIRGEFRRHARSIVPLGAFGIALGALWYVVNAVHYHAPFWPFSRFPSGPAEPYMWQTFGNRLLHEPLTTYRAVGWHNYLHYLGGVPILIGAAILVAALALLPAQRDNRRFLLVGGAIVIFQTLLWSDAQFTGIANGVTILVLSAQRYLDAAPFAAAAVLAIAARRPGLLRNLAVPCVVVALGVDLYVGHQQHWASGRIPPVATWIALVVAGALAGVLTMYAGRITVSFRSVVVAPVVTVAGAVLLAVPASSYLSNYLATGAAVFDGPVLKYLRTQPTWVDGTAPVAGGSSAHVTWGGVRFTHPLSWVPPNEPCPQLRYQATHGWLILVPTNGGVFDPLTYSLRTACLAGLTPVEELRSSPHQQPTVIYAPPRLVAHSDASTPALGVR